jgi:SHS2 domain-containing protein
MSKSFKFIDHIADIAIELEASTLEELFIAAADAWKISVTDSECPETYDSIDFELTGSSREELLVSFLNEINFFLTTKKWLGCSIESIKIIDETGLLELSAELKGINLNSKIELKHEIKSVTYHQLEIIEKNNIYSTRVVFDI